MATITTKYSVGDVVYHAGTTTERKQHPCPDCNGARKWKAVSPAGGEYDFSCPRCAASYNSFDDASLYYTAHVPNVTRLTIGSVQFNSARGSWDSGARYMCAETGVGSGTVYDENKLFDTEEAAIAAAEIHARLQDEGSTWIAKLYAKSLAVSDYQLGSAVLTVAKQEQSRAREMLWNLNDLFATIEEAEDKDAILDAVADYKRRDWTADKEACPASADTRPEGGDATEIAAPFTSGAVGNAETPNPDHRSTGE